MNELMNQDWIEENNIQINPTLKVPNSGKYNTTNQSDVNYVYKNQESSLSRINRVDRVDSISSDIQQHGWKKSRNYRNSTSFNSKFMGTDFTVPAKALCDLWGSQCRDMNAHHVNKNSQNKTKQNQKNMKCFKIWVYSAWSLRR